MSGVAPQREGERSPLLRSPLLLWGPVAAQMGIIFALSSIPDLSPPVGISDKSGHAIGYALLGGLLLRALAGGRVAGVTWKRSITAIAVATLYGVSDEFHQWFVPGRTPDVHDVLADFGGAALSVVASAVAAAAVRCGILKSS